MERAIFLIFLCAASEGDIGKQIFVSQSLQWADALAYCRRHHTDLSYISRQSDQDKVLEVSSHSSTGWIGLQLDPNNKTAWKWSAGAYMTYENWDDGQPDTQILEQNRVITQANGKWHDDRETASVPFYCISVKVVTDRKNWEAALRHCRDSQTQLISLHSENDRMTAQRQIQKTNTIERVWIGLRFLDRWLWVNGEPLDYQAWPQGGDQDHQCPVWKRCGALTKGGLWENRDCRERLNFICN